MLTDADLRKIRKVLAPFATRKDIGSSKNLGALWEKYAAIKIKLDQHERLIKELQKKSTLKKEDERSPRSRDGRSRRRCCRLRINCGARRAISLTRRTRQWGGKTARGTTISFRGCICRVFIRRVAVTR